MGNPNDPYVDSTLVGTSLLPGVDLIADGDTDLRAAAMFPDAVYE